MAGRRAIPPRTVAAVSLGSTLSPTTDRPMKQAEQAVLDLQGQARRTATTVTTHGTDITTLQTDVTALTTRVTTAESNITTLQGEVLGRLLAAPVRLTGSGSGTLPAGTAMFVLQITGAGGGGGGAQGGANQAAGGGGGPGEVLWIVVGSPGGTALASAYTWAMGTGGTAGSTSGGNGGAGGSSTLTHNAVVYTAGGGSGGTGMTNGGPPKFAAGGSSSASGTSALNTLSGIGTPGQLVVASFPVGGYGGPNPMGKAGSQLQDSSQNAPSDATGGGGGSGATAFATGRSGGVGGDGAAILWCYA